MLIFASSIIMLRLYAFVNVHVPSVYALSGRPRVSVKYLLKVQDSVHWLLSSLRGIIRLSLSIYMSHLYTPCLTEFTWCIECDVFVGNTR